MDEQHGEINDSASVCPQAYPPMDDGSSVVDGMTRLHVACRDGHLCDVKDLCVSKCDVNTTDTHGKSSLHWAILGGHFDVVEWLCMYAADVDKADCENVTPLLLATNHNRIDIVECLCMYGGSVDQSDIKGSAPLHVASKEGNLDIVKCLCMYGGDVNIADEEGRTALHMACGNGSLDVIECLCKYQADVNMTDKYGSSPLHVTSKAGHLHVAELLSQKYGACVNKADKDGKTALHLASGKGCLDMVEYLCTVSDDVNTKDKEGRTPLHVTCMAEQPDIATALATTPDLDPELALAPNMAAAPNLAQVPDQALNRHRTPDLAVVECLCRHGGHLTCTDSQGKSVLHYLGPGFLSTAIKENCSELAFRLLENRHEYMFSMESSTVRLLLAWSGEPNLPLISHVWSDPIKMELAIKLLEADNPTLIYDDTVYSDVIQAISCLKLKEASNVLGNVVAEWRSGMPSLRGVARAAIRNILRKTGMSFLKMITHFNGEVPYNVLSYVFLQEEACRGLPHFQENINKYFSVVHRAVSENRGSSSKRIDNTLVQHNDIHIDQLHNALRSSVSTSITDSIMWILSDMALQCPQSSALLMSKLSPSPLTVYEEIREMDSHVHVRSCSRHDFDTCSTHATCVIHTTVEKLLQTFLSHLTGGWTLRKAGSFYMDNKIYPFDELDFLATRDSEKLSVLAINNHKQNLRYQIKMPLSLQYNAHLCSKMFIYKALELYLRDVARPENPANGKVWVRSCYPHTRGPGVCVQLAWVCEKGHTHDLGVDVSPAIEWKECQIKDVWTLPVFFDKPPFRSIRDSVASLPVILIQARGTAIKENDNHMISAWHHTFCNTKPLIFDCLDSISTNIRAVFRIAKYVREFLPRKLQFSLPTRDIEGSWKSNCLISSYVVYSTLLQEVLQYPSPEDWADHVTGDRLVSVLTALRRWSYIDFFKDIRERSLSLTHLNETQRDSLQQRMELDIGQITNAVTAGTDHIAKSLDVFPNCQLYQDKVCIIQPDPVTGQVRYHLYSEGKLRYETSDIRREIGISERGDIYYYQVPRLLSCCKNFRLHHACVSLLEEKYRKSIKSPCSYQ